MGTEHTHITKNSPHRQGTKVCNTCGEVKPFAAFHRKKRNSDGYADKCRLCCYPEYRARYLWRKFGMTTADYERQLARQGGCCAICQSPDPHSMGSFMIDHDHRHCGKNRGCPECFRGLLCRQCNLRVGWVEKYLDEWTAYLGVLLSPLSDYLNSRAEVS